MVLAELAGPADVEGPAARGTPSSDCSGCGGAGGRCPSSSGGARSGRYLTLSRHDGRCSRWSRDLPSPVPRSPNGRGAPPASALSMAACTDSARRRPGGRGPRRGLRTGAWPGWKRWLPLSPRAFCRCLLVALPALALSLDASCRSARCRHGCFCSSPCSVAGARRDRAAPRPAKARLRPRRG